MNHIRNPQSSEVHNLSVKEEEMTKDDNNNDSVAEDETINVKTPTGPEKNPSFAVEEISDPEPVKIAQTQSEKQEPKQAKKEKVLDTIRPASLPRYVRRKNREKVTQTQPRKAIRPASLPRYVRRKNREKLIPNENQIESGLSERSTRQAVAATREDDKEDYRLALAGPTICPRPTESTEFVEPIMAMTEGNTIRPGAFRERGDGWNENIDDDEETKYEEEESTAGVKQQQQERNNVAVDNETPIIATLVPDEPIYEAETPPKSWLRRNRWRVLVSLGFVSLTFIVLVVTLILTLNNTKTIVTTNAPSQVPSATPSMMPTEIPSFAPSTSMLPTTMPTTELLEIFGRQFDRATTFINIDNSVLTGSIPSELGLWTNLSYLSLSGNQLTGTIPSELSLLTNLSELYLSYNQLTGSIPSELGLLTNLSRLYLGDNQLAGSIPSELGLLTNLSGLGLSGNQLTGTIPSELGLLTNLSYLSLYGNNFTGNVNTTFCEPKVIDYIRVDCDKVNCSCCMDSGWQEC